MNCFILKVLFLHFYLHTFHAPKQLVTRFSYPEHVLSCVFRAQKDNITSGHTLSFFFTTTVLSYVTQNSTRPPLKLSNVERITNFQILVLFGCLLAISLVCSIGQTIWKYQYGNDAWYMDLNCKSPNSLRCTSYSTYFVSLVHISLFLCHFMFVNAGMCCVVLCCLS